MYAFVLCLNFDQMIKAAAVAPIESKSSTLIFKRNVVCPCGQNLVPGYSWVQRRILQQPQELIKRGELQPCDCLPCPDSESLFKRKDRLGMPTVVNTGSAYAKALEECMMKNTMTILKNPKAETPRCSETVKDPGKH